MKSEFINGAAAVLGSGVHLRQTWIFRGARTGLFVPADGKLYVAAPARGGSRARVLVYGAHMR